MRCPTQLPDTGVFTTSLDDVTVHSSGWHRLKSGVWITSLPLWDSKNELFARPGHAKLEAWLRERRCRPATPAEYDELQLDPDNVFIEPYTLPPSEWLVRDGVPKPWQISEGPNKGADTPQMSHYRGIHMQSPRWCATHDDEVFNRLRAAGWDGKRPTSNAGKHWDPNGVLEGWYLRRGQLARIQPPSSYHRGVPGYRDYGTTTHAVFEGDEPPDLGAGGNFHPLPSQPVKQPTPTHLGDHGPAVTAWQEWLKDHGFDPGTVDGKDGPHTELATKRWEESTMLPGVDISGVQKFAAINWAVLAKQFSWGIDRAAYGVQADGIFLESVKAWRAAGMKIIGGYLFYRQPGKGGAQTKEKQLAVMMRQLSAAKIDVGDIVPVVDLEDNGRWDGPLDPKRQNSDARWIVEQLADSFGACMIYMPSYHFINIGRPSWVLEHPIWVADYGKDRAEPRIFEDWSIWQHRPRMFAGYELGPLDHSIARKLPTIS